MPTPRKRPTARKAPKSKPSVSKQPKAAKQISKPTAKGHMKPPAASKAKPKQSRSTHSTQAPSKGNRTTGMRMKSKKQASGGPAPSRSASKQHAKSHKPSGAAGSHANGKRTNQKAHSGNGTRAVSGANISAGVWTQNTKGNGSTGIVKSSGARRGSSDIPRMILGGLVAAAVAVGKGLKWLGRAIVRLCRRSKAATAVVVIVALLAVGFVVDSGANMNKINGNVKIGTIDVGGMTTQQAAQAVADEYGTRLNSGSVTVYASQEAMDTQAENPEVTDDTTVSEEDETTTSWVADANLLQARIDYDSLTKQAMQQGRGGFFDRLGLFFGSQEIPVTINYNASSIEALCQQIDATLGKSFVNWGIDVTDGVATVTEGADGNMVNRETFAKELDSKFLCDPTQQRAFVAHVEYAPVQIDKEGAQVAADKVNTAIAQGILFSCEGKSWTADSTTVGSWVQATITKDTDGNNILQPSLSMNTAKTEVLQHIQPTYTSGSGKVEFSNDNDNITVHVDSEGTMPQVGNAIASLNSKLFSGSMGGDGETPTVNIDSISIPSEMSLDDAISYGVVAKIQEFETEYTSGAEARNHNIHLAADLLNNSIVKADGGIWSFNDVAGECNEEKGFQAAGTIVDDETVDEIGGGICQVATTVFNAVYEAGYPVVQRTNHSLYISSYPTGRDAAISWPDLNLRWKNDGSSDVLVKMSHTDTTVTCTLYGVDPNYKVTTDVGNWVAGDKYKTTYKYDSMYSSGYSYIKTTGQDGKSISVVRTVTDASGKELHTDTFSSTYSARNEVIVRGGSASDYSGSSDSSITSRAA